MPDPDTSTPAPVEIDADSFATALQASAPQIGNPAGAVPPAEIPAKPDATTAQPTADKPEEKKPAEDSKPKKGLDALPEEKSEEKKPEDEKTKAETEEPEVDTSKWAKAQQEAFASARVKERRLKEQIKETQTRYEKLQKEFEAVKANPKDSEETLKKLQRLEQWESAQDLRNTDNWKKTIEEPIQKSLSMLERIASHAKIDAAALIKATDEPIEFERILAIRKIFEGAEEPVPDTLITAAVREAEKLHPLYEKGTELEKNAKEALSSLRHQTEQQKQEASKAAEAEYVKHHDHIYGQLSKKLPSMFNNPDVAEEVKSARPATDPADQAYQAQAAALLPSMAKEMLALREEVAREKASKLALLGARPSVNPSTTPVSKPIGADDTELDEDGLATALHKRG